VGTLLNTATVLTGGGIGISAGHRIPARVREGLLVILGLFTIVYGLRTTLSPAFSGTAAPDLAVVLLALLAGTAIGSALDLDGLLHRFGDAVEARGDPVAAGEHVAADLGLHGVHVIHQMGRADDQGKKNAGGGQQGKNI